MPPAPNPKLAISTVHVINNSGQTLKKGMRIYVTYYLKSGAMQTTSFVLVADLPNGGTSKFSVHGYAVKCTAQVNLLARPEPVLPPPVVR